ncbi:MAG: formylglycine-generating enzyme family protein [Planctomycetota bacterium]|nr:formylglycine-generating enzyme family protein [Planctomycetota bacterium]
MRTEWILMVGAALFGASCAENKDVAARRALDTVAFVRIEPGEFTMGSDVGQPSERPAHSVRITKAFELGKFELTQAQWEGVMGSNPSTRSVGPDYPVTHVSWNEAQEFCKRASKLTGRTWRLPTEAEWEYACRAGTTTAFSFGDEPELLDAHGWYFRNSGNSPLPADTVWDFNRAFELEGWGCRARPVGTKLPNPWGLHDMHGNVWEWCSDFYGAESYALPGSGVDPVGPTYGERRVVRGGSWIIGTADCRSSARYAIEANDRNAYYAFRVARSL